MASKQEQLQLYLCVEKLELLGKIIKQAEGFYINIDMEISGKGAFNEHEYICLGNSIKMLGEFYAKTYIKFQAILIKYNISKTYQDEIKQLYMLPIEENIKRRYNLIDNIGEMLEMVFADLGKCQTQLVKFGEKCGLYYTTSRIDYNFSQNTATKINK